MARLVLSSPLRRLCGQSLPLAGAGATVLEVVRDAVRQFPALRRKVLKTEEAIHPQVLVYIDGLLLMTGREGVAVDDSTEIQLLLIVGGG